MLWSMPWALYHQRWTLSKIPKKSIINNPKLRLCPFINRPAMDGHISGTMRKPFQFSFQNIRQNWKTIRTSKRYGHCHVHINTRGGSKILKKSDNPKLRLCPFIERPAMDGHISGTMRKPFQISFQNIRQNWKTIRISKRYGQCRGRLITRGGSKIPKKPIINNPKLRLCPFIDRPAMDGHISGTMRKPFQFSF